MWVFGKNNHGQLGDYEYRNKPDLLITDPEIKQISCDYYHTITLSHYHTIIYRNNGDVLVFGDNSKGQLGLGDSKHRNRPELLMTDPEIKHIICGSYYTIIYRNNGDVLVIMKMGN